MPEVESTSSARSPNVLRVPSDGAELHVEVRGEGPALVLFGCPMHAAPFARLADLLDGSRTVITTDPRGINRSSVVDPDSDVSPELLADDLTRILDYLDIGQSSLFGSSGGAVAALAAAAEHPTRFSTVIAHEPPLEELLDDRAVLRANTEDMVQTYLSGDLVGAWTKFFDGANISMPDGAVAGWIDGRTDPQELADERFFFAHTLRPTTWWLPDAGALRDGPTKIVVGVGDDSTGEVCDRTSAALSLALGPERAVFPGDHTGFVDHAQPFADQISTILSSNST